MKICFLFKLLIIIGSFSFSIFSNALTVNTSNSGQSYTTNEPSVTVTIPESESESDYTLDFTLQYRNAINGSWSVMYPRGRTSYNFSLPEGGGVYLFRYEEIECDDSSGNCYPPTFGSTHSVTYSSTPIKPSAVQNAQIVYDESTTSFVATWDAPPEDVDEYEINYDIEDLSIQARSTVNPDLYGYTVEKDWSTDDETEDNLPANVTQVVMPVSRNGYGKYASISIRAINAQGTGPSTRLQLERSITPPSTLIDLSYEIRNNERVAYFTWDAPNILGEPTSSDLYYEVSYLSDSGGTSGKKYYSSTFAAFDLTDDEYWDFSVKACLFDTCGNSSTIRAELTTQVSNVLEASFESGIENGWLSNGWLRDSGQTPSSGTGPGRAASGAYFAYFETSSPVNTGHEATLESPSFDASNSRLSFRYHMYGSSMGSLYVDVYSNGSWNSVWEQTGQQHTGIWSSWTEAEIDLSSYSGDIKIRFRGIDGNSYRGDMAVDDIEVSVSSTPEAYSGFDDAYKAYSGYVDSDGYEDIILAKSGTPSEGDLALIWNDVEQIYTIGSVSYVPVVTPVELVLGDFNVDGLIDVLIKDIEADRFDQIVFAPSLGESHSVVTAVDEEFQMFFRDVGSWMQDDTYFDNAIVSAEVPSYRYAIVYDVTLCYQGLSFGYFSFPICYSDSILLADTEVHISSSGAQELLPYVTDPLFYQAAGTLLEDLLETDYAIELASIDSGIVTGCVFYCNESYGSTFSARVYDLFIPSSVSIDVFDRENYSLKGKEFVEVFERAQNSDFSDQDAIADMEEIYADVLGLSSFSLASTDDYILGDAYRGVGEEDAGLDLGLLGLFKVLFMPELRGIIFNDIDIDAVLNSDPNNWERHVYGLETEVCSTSEDTVVTTGDGTFAGVIPAAVCSVENLFCWARRQPAPRANESDETLAVDGGQEDLSGVPGSGRIDPIITHVDEENYTYRNETDDGHLLHDSRQDENCADFAEYPMRGQIPDRCSYVERQVFEDENDFVKISTHGEGYNPVTEDYDFVEFNEIGGIRIFSDVDRWVINKLIREGVCPVSD